MKCKISIPRVDTHHWDLALVVDPYFEAAGKYLSRDYGGVLEHLWIDVELMPGRRADTGRPPWPFRFQQRVSISGRLQRMGLPAKTPDPENVGHFGVRPDFFKIAELAAKKVPHYLLECVYEESVVLEKKSRRLGGFDAERFRRLLRKHIDSIG